MKSKLGLVIFATLAIGLFTAPVFANRGPGALYGNGSWSIQYFTVSGGVCTSTPWAAYYTDGTGIGGPGISPVVSTSESICVKVSVTGDTVDANQSVWYQVPGRVSGVQLFTIAQDGSGTGSIIVDGSVLSSLAECATAPQEISLGGPSSSGSIADHFIKAGTECTTTTTTTSTTTPPSEIPEFDSMIVAMALGAFSIILAMGITGRKISKPL